MFGASDTGLDLWYVHISLCVIHFSSKQTHTKTKSMNQNYGYTNTLNAHINNNNPLNTQ